MGRARRLRVGHDLRCEGVIHMADATTTADPRSRFKASVDRATQRAAPDRGWGDGALTPLRQLASAARTTIFDSTTHAPDGGGLYARIQARRAEILGALGPVSPERLRAALAGDRRVGG